LPFCRRAGAVVRLRRQGARFIDHNCSPSPRKTLLLFAYELQRRALFLFLELFDAFGGERLAHNALTYF
jgi:hypothetical protein